MLCTRLVSSMLVLTALMALLSGSITSMAASVQENEEVERNMCIEEVASAHLAVHQEIIDLVDPILHERLLEARKYYTDETIDVPQPPFLINCQKIATKITIAQSAGSQCAAKYELNTFFADVYGEDERIREMAEYRYACDFGKMTGHLFRDFGWFQLFANPERLNQLEEFEKKRAKCWKKFGELLAKEVQIGGDVRDLVKEARKFYGNPGKSHEDFPEEPAGCKVLLGRIKEVGESSECAAMPDANILDLYYTSILGEPSRDVVEARAACEWGPYMAEFLSESLVGHLFISPRRERWLEEQEKLAKSIFQLESRSGPNQAVFSTKSGVKIPEQGK